MTSQAREPEIWRAREDACREQFDVCWWRVARHVGVRRGTSKPHVAKWHALYFVVGRAIARATKTKGMLESLLGMVRSEDEPGTHRGKNAGRTLAGLRANASRWPHVEQRILALCDAAEEGQWKRSWLVHSGIVPSEDGLFAALAKPSSGRPRAVVERFKVEQINRIAARFVWVSQAITYVLNTDEDGNVSFVDPLGPPPTGLRLVAVDFAVSHANLDPGLQALVARSEMRHCAAFRLGGPRRCHCVGSRPAPLGLRTTVQVWVMPRPRLPKIISTGSPAGSGDL